MAARTNFEPLCIELFAGLHGWGDGFVAEGFRVIGFDIVDMCAFLGKPKPHGCQLVLQDVLTLHGSQFKDAAVIVASPPCQFFSYTAMPWSRAKKLAAETRANPELLEQRLALFKACFRIQREASEAAGRHIPLVVENVVGALMPQRLSAVKVAGFRFDGSGRSFQSASVAETGVKVASESGRRTDPGNGVRFTSRDCGIEGQKGTTAAWFNDHKQNGVAIAEDQRLSYTSSRSHARKAASAQIAKIPFALSQWIARVYKPVMEKSA